MKTYHWGFVFTLLLSQFALCAQISKGSILLGGTLGATVQNGDGEHYLGGQIDPAVWFFPTERLAIGGMLTFGLAFNGENAITNFGGGPQARYYLNNGEKFRVFGQGNAVLLSEKTGAYNSRTVTGWGAGAGAGIFPTQRVAIEISLGYNFVHKGTFQQRGLGKWGIHFGVLRIF